MITLCYKDYPIKMSFEAMRRFKAATDKDLWLLLISFFESYIESADKPTLTRMRLLYELCDFETASQVFKAIIDNKEIPLEEIQNAMFLCGWTPSYEAGEGQEPWPLVMVVAALEIDKTFKEAKHAKKKAVMLERKSGKK